MGGRNGKRQADWASWQPVPTNQHERPIVNYEAILTMQGWNPTNETNRSGDDSESWFNIANSHKDIDIHLWMRGSPSNKKWFTPDLMEKNDRWPAIDTLDLFSDRNEKYLWKRQLYDDQSCFFGRIKTSRLVTTMYSNKGTRTGLLDPWLHGKFGKNAPRTSTKPVEKRLRSF